MSPSLPSPATSPPGARVAKPYAEVWGDTVDLKHLGKAVIVGAVISLACYFAARAVLSNFVEQPTIAKTYAMLAGLVGCLIAGTICAFLFKPKRDLSEQVLDDTWRAEALALLATEPGGLGSVASLPANVQAEMKELGLYDLFLRQEKLDADAILEARS